MSPAAREGSGEKEKRLVEEKQAEVILFSVIRPILCH